MGAKFAIVGAILERFARQSGVVLATFSFGLGIIWALAIKPLDAPDEPAHLQAIMQVRKQHMLPEVHYDANMPVEMLVARYGDQAVREYALKVKNPYSLVPYESTQPPLYYAIAGIAALAFPADPQTVLYIGRFVAVLFGAGTVYFCWKATRELAPGAPGLAIAVAGVIALLPQFCFNSATASNDSAASFAAAAAFYVWFRGLRQPNYDPWLLKAGAIVGLAILAKLTSLVLLPGLALLVTFRIFGNTWKSSKPEIGDYFRRGFYLGLGALGGVFAVCGWWLVRNVIVYGEATGMGDTLKSYTGDFIVLDWSSQRSRDLFPQYSWESIWGRFGWLDLSLPPDFYRQAIYLSTILVTLGVLMLTLAFGRWAILRQRTMPGYAAQAVFTMIPVVMTPLIGYVRFNLTVAFEAQGRYLFLALLPLALIFTGGLYAIMPGWIPRVLAFGILLVWLSWMNVVGLIVVSSVRQ